MIPRRTVLESYGQGVVSAEVASRVFQRCCNGRRGEGERCSLGSSEAVPRSCALYFKAGVTCVQELRQEVGDQSKATSMDKVAV